MSEAMPWRATLAGAKAAKRKRSSAKQKGRPTIESVTHANIEAILRVEDDERTARPYIYRVVAGAASLCGTVAFLIANLLLFAAWLAFNVTPLAFDPYPFTFLVLVVSLEAIVLAIMILISQNMGSEESERRHHLDLQINLLNEREMTAALRLLNGVATHLGLEGDAVNEVRTLAQDTNPEKVLHQIVKAEVKHSRVNDPPAVLRPSSPT